VALIKVWLYIGKETVSILKERVTAAEANTFQLHRFNIQSDLYNNSKERLFNRSQQLS
jgi:hypothetical protein